MIWSRVRCTALVWGWLWPPVLQVAVEKTCFQHRRLHRSGPGPANRPSRFSADPTSSTRATHHIELDFHHATQLPSP